MVATVRLGRRKRGRAVLADIFGMDGIVVVIIVIAVLFGSSQIPKIARSLGSAQGEFKKGLEEGKGDASSDKDTKNS
jgi:sec-independent protein translocase protein TatA